ncbi:MAG: phenylacetate--CoA ligase family protein [Deltaproteobacteria bacterium]|nr:phenylacetate--CoA ligase family protein [Deltaproteobacteria bacterium]
MERSDSAPARAAAVDPDQRLREAIARARRSAFYAKHLAGLDVGGRSDLPRLPLTFKQHLRDATPFGMLAVAPAKAWHYHESSGTTGEPISTWCGLNELREMAAVVRRMTPELSADTILLNRFPLFAPVSFVFEEALRQAGACHIAAGNMSWDVPFTRALEFIGRLHVTALSSLPLEPILLHELAKEQGLDLRRELGSVRVIFAGGAVLPPALRRAIEQDWQARVVEIYGSNETMLLGVSCTAGRLHLCADLLEIEVLEPTAHTPVGPGEAGVLTVTSLIHEAMPLVRYFTGDLVRLGNTACSCGQAGPTAEVLGRFDDVVEIGGKRVSAYEILDAAYEFADRVGTRIFFILIRRRGLHLLMEVAAPANAGDAAAERRLAERVGLPVTVEYLGPNEVLDRSAMFRGPKIYKPSVMSDWRGDGRKAITIMEALLEWPRFDWRTLLHLGRRQLRNARRRRRILREDRR